MKKVLYSLVVLLLISSGAVMRPLVRKEVLPQDRLSVTTDSLLVSVDKLDIAIKNLERAAK